MVDWLAGNRIRGTSTERTSTTGFNPALTVTGGWKEVGRTTLGSSTTDIDVSSLPNKRYYMILAHNILGANNNWNFRTGSGSIDTGNNYAQRRSYNGGSDATSTSFNRFGDVFTGQNYDRFTVGYVANLSGKEKLFQFNIVDRLSTGAAAPDRCELVGKWVNTSNPLDILQLKGANNTFGTGSELVVLGWDPADTHTTNFWEELASVELTGTSATLDSGTITAKRYLWIQYYIGTRTATNNDLMTFNSDTGSNYAQREQRNGGSDGTRTNHPNIFSVPETSPSTNPTFSNTFIVNDSANEKLLISHCFAQNTAGAGNAPSERYEIFGKWTNTSSQITRITITANTSTYPTGSILKVWGSN